MCMLERDLQNYLVASVGRNLSKIDPELIFLDSEYSFPGGRIDILASKNGVPVAIELKAKEYSSSQVSGQLINYHTFLSKKNGEVYFVAPKIKPGVFSTMSSYESTRFFEFDAKLNFYEVFASNPKKKFFDTFIPPVKTDLLGTYLRIPVAKVFSKATKSVLGF